MDKLKLKVQNADWWEIGYLIIYGAILTFEFLNTTMFEIEWPPRFAFLFMGASALYTIAKFIWHNTYTKKEMVFSAIILVAFVVPALLTDYSFLFFTGFMIVGAKDVDFKKILKVYLVISITIMVAAFAASQYGLIEDLQYIVYRNEMDHIRHSYGIIYPTDYAAHLFYMFLAAVIYFNEKLSVSGRVWLCVLLLGSVYLTSNAQTTTLCLMIFTIFCVFEKVFRKYMVNIEKVLRWIPVVCATVFLSLSYFYDSETEWKLKLNAWLSERLEISKKAFDNYDVKLFGQNIIEVGNGSAVEYRPDYFFLDDSYLSILMKYGIALFLVMLIILVAVSRKAGKEKNFLIVIALVAISVHSVMEHHLIEIAYNPITLALFASLTKEKQNDRRRKCIEETVKVGSNIGTSF